MKNLYKISASLLLTALFLSFLSAAIPVSATKTPQTQFVNTSKELSEHILHSVARREAYISIAVPNTLPEAKMKGTDLLRQILRQDSGYNRWSHQGGNVKKTTKSDHVVFEYSLTYRSTREQDEIARNLAAELVAAWDTKNLSDREKIGLIKAYISANWRYDDTLAGITAYSTMTQKRGTCLGMTMATQLLLDEMGIQSQTIHGTILQTGVLHIRLLVKLGNLWYTLDPTHLALKNPSLFVYLKQEHGKDFLPDAEYLTDSFRHSYPMTLADLHAA